MTEPHTANRSSNDFIAHLGFEDRTHWDRPLWEVVIAMMDFAIGPYISMATIRVLNIPVEIPFITSRWWRVGNPLIALDVQIPSVTWPERVCVQTSEASIRSLSQP